jgi:predicted nicotinamide N-methyase
MSLLAGDDHRLLAVRAVDLVSAMAPSDLVLEAFRQEHPSLKEDSCADTTVAVQEIFGSMVNILYEDEMGPSKRYLQRLLLKFISVVVGEDRTESEALMQLLLKRLSIRNSFPDANECCHVSFRIQRLRHEIPLRIRIFPQHNDVALRMWEAGAVLSEFFVQCGGLLAGRKVVELGAGTAVTGLVAAGCCKASHVHCTDFTQASLDNMKHNVAINEPWLRQKRPKEEPQSVISSGYLEWGEFGNGIDENLNPEAAVNPLLVPSADHLIQGDTLIAADVVYDKAILSPLVRTIWYFLTATTSSPHEKTAIFATTIRNQSTFQLFQEQLHSQGISSQILLSRKECGNLQLVFPMNFIQPRSDVVIYSLHLQRKPTK